MIWHALDLPKLVEQRETLRGLIRALEGHRSPSHTAFDPEDARADRQRDHLCAALAALDERIGARITIEMLVHLTSVAEVAP